MDIADFKSQMMNTIVVYGLTAIVALCALWVIFQSKFGIVPKIAAGTILVAEIGYWIFVVSFLRGF